MKILFEKSFLNEALKNLARQVPAKPALPVLGGMKIVAKEGEDNVLLTCTNGESLLQVKVPATYQGEVSVVLPAKLIVDLVGKAQGDTVSFSREEDETVVTLAAGKLKAQLTPFSLGDFPTDPQIQGDPDLFLAGNKLGDSVARVLPAASGDASRPTLTGVQIVAEGDYMYAAATDSYRLHVQKSELPVKMAERKEVLIPARSLAEILRIAGGMEEDIQLYFNHGQLIMLAGNSMFACRLLDGKFPEYHALIPKEFSYQFPVSVKELEGAVSRIQLLLPSGAPVQLGLDGDGITVSAKGSESGEASETVEAEISGEPMTIGFNPDFLLAGLKSAECEQVTMRLIGPMKPGLLQPADDQDFLCLIMPLRLPS